MNQDDIISIIGWLAAAASTTSFAPQAWKIIRTRDVKGLSPAMYALTVTAFALWLTYGFMRGDWALMVPNALCLGLALFIWAMILLPRPMRKQVAKQVEEIAPGVAPNS
jgi:MtN3 and saliva related transmembrane protein